MHEIARRRALATGSCRLVTGPVEVTCVDTPDLHQYRTVRQSGKLDPVDGPSTAYDVTSQ